MSSTPWKLWNDPSGPWKPWLSYNTLLRTLKALIYIYAFHGHPEICLSMALTEINGYIPCIAKNVIWQYLRKLITAKHNFSIELIGQNFVLKSNKTKCEKGFKILEIWISWEKKNRSVFRVVCDKREIDIWKSYESAQIG